MQASYELNFHDSCCAQRLDQRYTVKLPMSWEKSQNLLNGGSYLQIDMA
jgi:hypothetical protein